MDRSELPKPDKPITLGIDGGYLRQWDDKAKKFEVIVGCSVPKQAASKKFGYVQSVDDNLCMANSNFRLRSELDISLCSGIATNSCRA